MVKSVAALAVIALDVEELVAQRLDVGSGELDGVGDMVLAAVHGPRVIGGVGFQGQPELGKGPRVVGDQDFRRQAIGAFEHDLVAVVEDRATGVGKAANDETGRGGVAEQAAGFSG